MNDDKVRKLVEKVKAHLDNLNENSDNEEIGDLLDAADVFCLYGPEFDNVEALVESFDEEDEEVFDDDNDEFV